MKAIILAAGQGTRLKPLTNDRPKCMVEYQDKPIINYILETMKECDISDIAVINGYKKDVLEDYLKHEKLTFYTNENFATTNMVSTLFCAKDFMNDDLIISYADILYKNEVLAKIIDSKSNFNVVVDKKWKELWEQRMENPLEDVETLKIKDGNIVELGKKPKSYYDIEGQYIGLMKISKNVINEIIDFYFALDKKKTYDGQNFENMYMTSFIQLIIDNLTNVNPVFINGGWVEIDCIEDMKSEMVND